MFEGLVVFAARAGINTVFMLPDAQLAGTYKAAARFCVGEAGQRAARQDQERCDD